MPANGDLGVLDDVSPDNWNAVFDHLAADPRWRVCVYEHAIVALERTRDADGWSVPRDGFHHDGADVWSVLFRFTGWDDDVGPLVRAGSMVGAGSAVEASGLATSPVGAGGLAGPTIRVYSGGAVALEAYEQSHRAHRSPHLADAVREARSLVPALLADAAAIASLGYDPASLPAGEPVRGPTSLTLTSPGPGQIEVRGRINPGRPGWTWLRLVVDGQAWAEDEVAVGTREATGWSADGEQTFWYEGTFSVPTGAGFPATAELWTQPADQGPAVRVYSAALDVPAR